MLSALWAMAWLAVMRPQDVRPTLIVAAVTTLLVLGIAAVIYLPLPVWGRGLGLFAICGGLGFWVRGTSVGNDVSAMEQFESLLGAANSVILLLVAFVATLGISGVDVSWLNPTRVTPFVVAANLAGPLAVAAVLIVTPVVSGFAAGFYARFRR